MSYLPHKLFLGISSSLYPTDHKLFNTFSSQESTKLHAFNWWKQIFSNKMTMILCYLYMNKHIHTHRCTTFNPFFKDIFFHLGAFSKETTISVIWKHRIDLHLHSSGCIVNFLLHTLSKFFFVIVP